MILRRILHEVSGLIAGLTLTAVVLGVAVLIKDGLITNTQLIENKDLFDAISKIAVTIVITIGGMLSYVRFFGTHALRPRVILKLQSGVISIDKDLLHWLEIEIQNIGSSSIWNYDVEVYAIYHGTHSHPGEVIEFVSAPKVLEITEQFVDNGESAFEHALVVVPRHVSAVTFQVVLRDESNAMWTRGLTVKNSES